MASYQIIGGKKLSGTVSTKTAKNSALACMCASLLTTEPVILKDVPKIHDVFSLEKVLKSIGVKTSWKGQTLRLQAPKELRLEKIDYESARKTRIILLTIGALANRYQHFKIPRAGGCKLGRRSITPHLYGLERLGLKITTTPNYYNIRRNKHIRGSKIVMYESGDTTTENILLCAALANGTTEIHLASANYMVQDLAHLLNAMGAKIKNIGYTQMTVEGVKKLHGATHFIIPDPIESMFWISLAVTTNSSLLIKGCPEEFLELELLKLEKMGWKYAVTKRHLSKSGKFKLIDIQTRASKLTAPPDKIYSRPFPGLNIDNLPFFVPIATRAKGITLIHDWCYENRTLYYLEFQKLGANMQLADPHRIFITGPTELKPNEIICPPALRPATILAIGMIAAKGKSILRNTYSIDRGYENLYTRLKKIGANIKEIS